MNNELTTKSGESFPPPYLLMSKNFQRKLDRAYRSGKTIEVWRVSAGAWKEFRNFDKVADDGDCLGYSYRVQPKPRVEITVTVNGKAVDPVGLSDESWAAMKPRSS